jgi:hypothetical protein
MLNDIRGKIHKLALEYGVPSDPQGAPQGCLYCANSMGESQFAGAESENRSEFLSEL